MSDNDGGLVFPHKGIVLDKWSNGQNRAIESYNSGMSMRDWFASQAPEIPKYWLIMCLLMRFQVHKRLKLEHP